MVPARPISWEPQLRDVHNAVQSRTAYHVVRIRRSTTQLLKDRTIFGDPLATS